MTKTDRQRKLWNCKNTINHITVQIAIIHYTYSCQQSSCWHTVRAKSPSEKVSKDITDLRSLLVSCTSSGKKFFTGGLSSDYRETPVNARSLQILTGYFRHLWVTQLCD